MSKTVDEEMKKLWEQATTEQKYIIVRFMRNIVKSKKRPERITASGVSIRTGRCVCLSWSGIKSDLRRKARRSTANPG